MASEFGDLFKFATSMDEVETFSDPISTGSLKFDIFLGGGYRTGVTRFGAPSEHGKTAQCLCWAKEWLKKYPITGVVYYIDAEGRLTIDKLKESGIINAPNFNWVKDWESEGNFKSTIYNVYDHIMNYFHKIIIENESVNPNLKKKFFFAIDSLDMMIASKDVVKNFSQAEQIGAAQVISAQVMKRIGAYMAKFGHHFHVLSQIRANVETSNPNSPKTKISGGNAMLHGSSLTGEIQKDWSEMYIYENPKGASKALKGNVIGRLHTIKFTKTFNNKTHHILKIPIKYGHGIWREREIVDILLAHGLMTAKGTWYSLSPTIIELIENEMKTCEITKWQGYESIVKFLEEEKALAQCLENIIKKCCLDVPTERIDDEEIDRLALDEA